MPLSPAMQMLGAFAEFERAQILGIPDLRVGCWRAVVCGRGRKRAAVRRRLVRARDKRPRFY